MAQPQQHQRQERNRQSQQGSQARGAEGIQSRSEPGLQRGSTAPALGPWSLMRRISQDMDRIFGDFFGTRALQGAGWPGGLAETPFWPEIDVSHSGNKLIVQADIPGIKKEDVNIEVLDHQLCISGKRQTESEQKEGRTYRSERSYGSFCRTIPLPEGAKLDTASASFEDGVLKIEMEAPSTEQDQGRRIEIR